MDSEASPNDQTSIPGPPPLRPEKRSFRILVVEDEPVIRNLTATALRRAGHHVEVAVDGEEAWENVQGHAYDLIVTDHNMPKLSGVGLLQNLRAAGMAVPVIMVSGCYPEQELSRYPWLQPEATLLKPFSFDDLYRTVGAVLQPIAAASAPVHPSEPLAKERQGPAP